MNLDYVLLKNAKKKNVFNFDLAYILRIYTCYNFVCYFDDVTQEKNKVRTRNVKSGVNIIRLLSRLRNIFIPVRIFAL